VKIDFKYIKEMLEVIQNVESSTFDLQIFAYEWFNADDTTNKDQKFIFHIEILDDMGLIKSASNTVGIGISRSIEGSPLISFIPLRLTSDGHEYASALSKPGVLETLIKDFKEAGPKEAYIVVKKLAQKYVENKLSKAVGFCETGNKESNES